MITKKQCERLKERKQEILQDLEAKMADCEDNIGNCKGDKCKSQSEYELKRN